MEQLAGIGKLRSKLASKKIRVLTKYEYYDQKYAIRDNGISTPETKINIQVKVGWCTKAVDALADRLVFKGFRNDVFDMQTIFDNNNPDVFFSSAILSALISSCSFVYISEDEGSVHPSLQVIDGANATGIIDTKTGLLKEGYAILDTDENGSPIVEAYFTPDYTEYYEKGKEPYQVENKAGYPLLVPIIYKPSDTRPFGHSRITRACMDIVQGACNTLKRAEISAEFYSYPQKYIVGLEKGVKFDKWKAAMSSVIQITKDSEGDVPKLGQFQQQSMAPHMDHMQMYVKQFCGETGLTPNDLGFVSDNPTSAEAIKASHETLRSIARKAQKNFGTCFVNVGFVARCLEDEYKYRRNIINTVKPVWEPIFEPDASSLSSIGDGAIKLNQAVPGYVNKDNLSILTGLEASELEPAEGGE
ncbi:MAG: phage portal protein [Holdemanella sp.]|nr:phage portal protein [Holdemanella sp.]